MPSLTAYTPYETLAFCQSVARHGSDPVAFETIAKSLNANQLIRENLTYDHARLTAAALEALYQDLLVEERNADALTVNGDNVNPRKRKLSTSPPPDNNEPAEERVLQSLVDKLYARFREQTIKEIRAEEEAYAEIEAQITELEKKVANEQQTRGTVEEVKGESQTAVHQVEGGAPSVSDPRPSPDAAAAQLHASLGASRAEPVVPTAEVSPTEATLSPSSIRSGQQRPVVASASPAPSTPSVSSATQAAESAQARASQPPGHAHRRSPGGFHRTLPAPSPQRPNYGPINPQHFQPGPQGHPVPVLPGMPGMPHMPPPAEFPGQKRSSSSSGAGRGSPIPMPPQQAYPGYPGYPPPPWPHQIPPPHQYQPPYGNPQYYVQSPTGRPGIPYQTPHHPAYQAYPQSAPLHYPSQPPPPHGWHPQPGQPYYGYHGSANVTPVPRTDARRQVLRGRSSTPWKRRAEASTRIRQSSPVRPERDVSPLTDTESPAQPRKVRKSPQRKGRRSGGNLLLAPEAATARGRQVASVTPAAVAESTSGSMASLTSDPPPEKRKRGRPPQKIKAEPPSTPAPVFSDSEQAQRTSNRSQNGAVTWANDPIRNTTAATKRKRSPERDSVTPRLPSPAPAQLPQRIPRDSSLVTVSRNFAKTSQLLLSEILSHKLAGIFAKPLSERDAPGYKDLVFRPQDLKSIKAAISRGGKAALAAIEALDGEDQSNEEAPPKSASSPTSEAREGPVGSGFYLVKASEDLVPPRGIVNPSQLEMELVRMFANAIMFNPLPSSDRGFGRSLRLRKDQPDKHSDGDTSDDSASSEQGTRPDEGGIISDTREMFEGVLAQIRKWREDVERLGADDGSRAVQPPGSFGGQHSSANASVRHSSVGSALNEDEGGREASTPVPTTGTARKRRRIAES
ncbi:hypothetical protein A1O3_10440 [Capronia epimyces CBS 606.96]|uniref:Bromo domain-containing protein n=1 Tax=Capronia epimyces CBS 606.96 TaxID=1182542 RepID=W9X9Y9_9EURO|nr:uncharacterized protein A1O3_10440 [Capronia epimyces CBS 606.96]EXJ77282.1 hypothetical protein A1O3_10440 [Capronia epimyces CBS 606.96]